MSAARPCPADQATATDDETARRARVGPVRPVVDEPGHPARAQRPAGGSRSSSSRSRPGSTGTTRQRPGGVVARGRLFDDERRADAAPTAGRRPTGPRRGTRPNRFLGGRAVHALVPPGARVAAEVVPRGRSRGHPTARATRCTRRTRGRRAHDPHHLVGRPRRVRDVLHDVARHRDVERWRRRTAGAHPRPPRRGLAASASVHGVGVDVEPDVARARRAEGSRELGRPGAHVEDGGAGGRSGVRRAGDRVVGEVAVETVGVGLLHRKRETGRATDEPCDTVRRSGFTGARTSRTLRSVGVPITTEDFCVRNPLSRCCCSTGGT